MRGEENIAQAARRLAELAKRSSDTGLTFYTGFLSPPEADLASIAARKNGVTVLFSGGYEDAERKIACFCADEDDEVSFPLVSLKLTWPHQSAPAHRDVLGSVMGLSIKRLCVGDIVMQDDCGYLFAERNMGDHIAQSLLSAGRVKLQVEAMQETAALESPEGTEVRDTVLSLRLDGVVAGGFGMSRSKASALISSGQVKLRHIPTEKTDAKVALGDTISARGYGRLVLTEIGAPTKKGRTPLKLMRYGERRGR